MADQLENTLNEYLKKVKIMKEGLSQVYPDTIMQNFNGICQVLAEDIERNNILDEYIDAVFSKNPENNINKLISKEIEVNEIMDSMKPEIIQKIYNLNKLF
jgi:hypothetical protein